MNPPDDSAPTDDSNTGPDDPTGTADSNTGPDDPTGTAHSAATDDSVAPRSADETPRRSPTGDRGIERRRAALVLAAGAVPWAVIPYERGSALLFSVGQVTSPPLVFQPVYRYLVQGGPLPQPLLAWPMATFLYLLGLVSAGLALVGQEDRRVTAGLFALSGLDLLYFAVAFSSVRLRVVAFPIGVVALWLAAWASRPNHWVR
jgi:uncharacterized protein (TIGR04206 family)